MKDTNSLLSLNIEWSFVGDGSVNICIQIVKSSFQVINTYWMIGFKIHVSDALLFDKTPNRSNSEIWESFLSWIICPITWRLSKNILPSSKNFGQWSW